MPEDQGIVARCSHPSREGFPDLSLRRLPLIAAFVAMLTVPGCNQKPGAAESSAKPASAPSVIDAATAASITGTVTLDGAPAAVGPINMDSEPDCVQQGSAPVVPPTAITGENGGLANVVVYVKDGLGSYRFDPPNDPVVLDQKGCMYEPHVFALMTNQKLLVRNLDATVHNVHSMPRLNPESNQAQRAKGLSLEMRFPHAEIAIPFMCNVHPWMRGFAFVFDHPYFAVTSKSGAFELHHLPPGTYTIEAWQETFGTERQTVKLEAKESKTISFRFESAGSRSGSS